MLYHKEWLKIKKEINDLAFKFLDAEGTREYQSNTQGMDCGARQKATQVTFQFLLCLETLCV